MTGTRRAGAVAALVAGVALLVAAFVLVAVGGGTGSRAGSGSGDALTAPEPGTAAGAPAVERFLSDYVEDDGRVVRRDQGGDTVSEGQAYALLLALAAGDEHRFATVWSWTHDNLQRADGLFAWRWQDGQVADDNPASDADLDIARALAVAADRFDRPELTDEARRIATAVMERETTTIAGRPQLVAGPWAVDEGVVNPSYLARCDGPDLAELTGDDRWRQVGSGGRDLLAALTDSRLPPDWAKLDGGGTAHPMAGPDADGPGRYGLDAARIPVRLAACAADDRRDLAAALWPRLRDLADRGANVAYELDGAPAEAATHPLGLVGAAAAASAAGERDHAQELLAEAEDLQTEHPTYYGAAWLAFGQLLLESDDGDSGDDVAAPAWRPASAGRPAQEQPTTTDVPPSTTATTATSTTPSTTGTPGTTAGSPTTTTTGPGETPSPTDGTGATGPAGGDGDPSTSSTTPTGSTTTDPSGTTGPGRSAEPGATGDLSGDTDDQPLPFGDEAAAAEGEGPRRKTGALTLAGFGTALVLGAVLGLRERTLTRRTGTT